MKFLIYSSTNSSTIESNLGGVDYSYYFVLKSYLPLLREFGDVEILEQPLSAKNEAAWQIDDETYYLSFTPPNLVDLSSSARIVPVFAWEFGTLPDENFVSVRDNWNYVLQRVVGAITHSRYAVDVVRKSLGDNYRVSSIPAPVWESFADIRSAREQGVLCLKRLQLDCTVIDSADFTVAQGELVCSTPLHSDSLIRVGSPWRGERIDLLFSPGSQSPVYFGFTQRPSGELCLDKGPGWIVLPRYISSPCQLEIDLTSDKSASGALVNISLGDSSVLVRLEGGLLKHRLLFEGGSAANILVFSVPPVDNKPDSIAMSVDKVSISAVSQSRESINLLADLSRDDSLYCYGFHHVEPWGRWTEQAVCGVTLPHSVSGNVKVRFNIQNSFIAAGNSFQVQLGDQVAIVDLRDAPQLVETLFIDLSGTDHLCFKGLDGALLGDADDSRLLGIGIADLEVQAVPDSSLAEVVGTSPNLLLDAGILQSGFHEVESWGRWSSKQDCAIALPYKVAGKVKVSLVIVNNPHRQRGPISLQLGGQVQEVELTGHRQKVTFEFKGIKQTNLIRIGGILVQHLDKSSDLRQLGLGFGSLKVSFREKDSKSLAETHGESVDGNDLVVYSTVFSPVDGRKNWPDILNAFVFALRDKANATLIVKIVHGQLQPFVDDLCSYFADLAPFKCRMIFIHGYLSDDHYRRLMYASSYIVNASRGEGQCLPLMEFMSCGVPAIAPDNTAMADYVSAENAFVVESTIEPAVWPQDPRLLFRTTRYRINWESLYDAYQESYSVAAGQDKAYRKMSDQAVRSLHAHCSIDSARAKMSSFLKEISVDDR